MLLTPYPDASCAYPSSTARATHQPSGHRACPHAIRAGCTERSCRMHGFGASKLPCLQARPDAAPGSSRVCSGRGQGGVEDLPRPGNLRLRLAQVAEPLVHGRRSQVNRCEHRMICEPAGRGEAEDQGRIPGEDVDRPLVRCGGPLEVAFLVAHHAEIVGDLGRPARTIRSRSDRRRPTARATLDARRRERPDRDSCRTFRLRRGAHRACRREGQGAGSRSRHGSFFIARWATGALYGGDGSAVNEVRVKPR